MTMRVSFLLVKIANQIYYHKKSNASAQRK